MKHTSLLSLMLVYYFSHMHDAATIEQHNFLGQITRAALKKPIVSADQGSVTNLSVQKLNMMKALLDAHIIKEHNKHVYKNNSINRKIS